MSFVVTLTLSLLFALSACSTIPTDPAAQVASVLQKTRGSVFEVVAEDHALSQVESQIVAQLKQAQGDSKKHYSWIGTAFYMGQNHFITAAHVIGLGTGNQWKRVLLHGVNNNWLSVTKVTRYSSVLDIAEFEVDKVPEDLHALEVGPAADTGDAVIVAGNALGRGLFYRKSTVADVVTSEYGSWKEMVVKSVLLHGDSGGPLFNLKGQVIGINVRVDEQDSRIGFVVPVDLRSRLAQNKAEIAGKISGHRDYMPITAQFSFELDLPEMLQKLVILSAAKEAQAYAEQLKPYVDPQDTRFFPKNPHFQEFLRYQNQVDDVARLVAASDGNLWQNFSVEGVFHELGPNNEGLLLYAKKEQNWRAFRMDKPPQMPLRDFISQPKLIMDRFLKVEPAVASGSQTTPTTLNTLGEPDSKTFIVDDMTRRWSIYVWNIGEQRIELKCLPTPEGVICEFVQPNQLAASFEPEVFTKLVLDEFQNSYIGSVQEWQEFLALPPENIPAFLTGMRIQWGGNKLSVRTADLSANLKDQRLTKDSIITMSTRYLAKDPLQMGIREINLRPVSDFPGSFFSIAINYDVPQNTPAELQGPWRELKSHKGVYDEKTHSDENHAFIAKSVQIKSNEGVSSSVLTYGCSEQSTAAPQHLSTKQFEKVCREFLRDNKMERLNSLSDD